MTEARRTAYELTLGGKLKALSDRLFCLLHGERRPSTESLTQLGKEKLDSINLKSAFGDWSIRGSMDLSLIFNLGMHFIPLVRAASVAEHGGLPQERDGVS